MASNEEGSQSRAELPEELSLDLAVAREGLAQLELMAQRAKDLLHFLDTQNQAVVEIERSAAAVEDPQGRRGIETLVDIGAGQYVRGTVDPASPLLVNIGLGIFVEMDREEARRHAEDCVQSLARQITLFEEGLPE